MDGITINVLEMTVTHPDVDAFITRITPLTKLDVDAFITRISLLTKLSNSPFFLSQKSRPPMQTSTIRIPTTQLAILDTRIWSSCSARGPKIQPFEKPFDLRTTNLRTS